jgi:hypothetical protein
MATVIASQAVISGAFSIKKQAVQLGYLPRLRIEHTSRRHAGRVYGGAINWLFMIACIGLVMGFRSTDSLAAAYGFAVSTDMVLTVLLVALQAHLRWQPGRGDHGAGSAAHRPDLLGRERHEAPARRLAFFEEPDVLQDSTEPRGRAGRADRFLTAAFAMGVRRLPFVRAKDGR